MHLVVNIFLSNAVKSSYFHIESTFAVLSKAIFMKINVENVPVVSVKICELCSNSEPVTDNNCEFDSLQETIQLARRMSRTVLVYCLSLEEQVVFHHYSFCHDMIPSY